VSSTHADAIAERWSQFHWRKTDIDFVSLLHCSPDLLTSYMLSVRKQCRMTSNQGSLNLSNGDAGEVAHQSFECQATVPGAYAHQ
jgi:hypothetical protein